MPITPRNGESQSDFMERCMSEVSDADPDRSNEQNVAICSTAWRDAHGGKKPKSFFDEDYDTFMENCIDETGDEAECQARWDEMDKSMTSTRAYSILNIKKFVEDERVIEGMATTPSTDRVGDIVEPMGAKFTTPFPLLWQHRSSEPVGYVEVAEPTPEGIKFRARIAQIAEPGELKNLCDKAWQAVKAKLVKAVSIGFTIKESERIQKGRGMRIKEWEWLELSLVTIPANMDASIHTIRSLDTELIAARKKQPPMSAAGASQPTRIVKLKEATMAKKTIAEQVSAFENTRAAKAARMEEIMETAGDKGETLNADQTQEYDSLVDEVKSVDDHLTRLRVLEKTNIAKAIVLPNRVESPDEASRARDPIRVTTVRREVAPWQPFVRTVIAQAQARGNVLLAHEIAKGNPQWMEETPEVAGFLKATVLPATTVDAIWAGPLVQYQNLPSAFAEWLRPLTIIGRIPGMRMVPFKIRVPRMTGASTVNWVGEGRAKPLSSLAFDTITLDFAKIAGIIPLTEEVVRFSSPGIEQIVRDELRDAIVQFMDNQFVDPSKAATDVSPASITNGAYSITPSGTNAAALRSDIARLMAGFLQSNQGLGSAVWIMTQTTAMRLSMMVNTLGQQEFAGISAAGGTLAGLPVVTSENIPSTTGSPDMGWPMIIMKADEVLLADDGQVTIDASREASLQMESAPDSPPTATTVLTSLWQHNMVAIKAERFINWRLRRNNAVAYVAGANYT